MKCPCRGCPDRTITCHYEGFCDKWSEWKKFHLARKAWLASFRPPSNDNVRKRETYKIRQRARGWNGKKGGVRDDR